jgi:type IV secretion system protein VirD4
MNQATLAWAAFKNMLRAAARDPVWAISSILMSPFRAGRYLGSSQKTENKAR